jgi:hypothetical protein
MSEHERKYVLFKRIHEARVQFDFSELRERMNDCLIDRDNQPGEFARSSHGVLHRSNASVSNDEKNAGKL